jgi:opacity protein-like surface antigen/outer membrane protease
MTLSDRNYKGSSLEPIAIHLFVLVWARDEEPIHPMTLGNMRRHGVSGLFVTCGHERAVNMDDSSNLNCDADGIDGVSAMQHIRRKRTPEQDQSPFLVAMSGAIRSVPCGGRVAHFTEWLRHDSPRSHGTGEKGGEMHSRYLSSAATSVLFAVLAPGFVPGAVAADLPVKAPPAQYPPAWSWAGFYGGVNFAAALGRTTFSDPFGASIFGDRTPTPGYGLGGQIGYNWQTGNWVYGLEADATWLRSDSTMTCGAFSGLYASSNCGARPDANGTVTGRLGLALGPAEHTLVYAKGGFAWQHSDVNATLNNNATLVVPFLNNVIFPPVTNSASLTQAGWTIGAGVEQSLTPAWSIRFEYDYLNFGHQGSVLIPASLLGPVGTAPNGGALFQREPAATSNVSSDVHMFKLALNYKLGQDPWAPGWGAAVPVLGKAPPMLFAPGWEFEGGGRYWYSWGRFQKDFPAGPSNDHSLESRLTYDNLTASTGEFFGRIDTPVNVFLQGFVGGGSISGGHLNDEDWALHQTPSQFVAYSNTILADVTGPLFYGTIDVGYDLLRGPGYKAGPFVGYNRYSYTLNAGGCVQIGSPSNQTAPCAGAAAEPTSHIAIIEQDTWDSLRVGAAGETILADRWKLSGDVAYVPYTKFTGTDQHLNFVPVEIFDESGHGTGVQAEAFLSYLVTNQISVGVGGRYWAMWTTSGNDVVSGASSARNDTFRTDRVGVTFQASYKF